MTVSENRVDYQPFPKLTETFVAEKLRVGWSDLAWAATNHWLDAHSLAELGDRLAAGDEDMRVAIASAALDGDDATLKAIFDRAAARDESSEDCGARALDALGCCVAVPAP
jgi:hypothetical protein